MPVNKLSNNNNNSIKIILTIVSKRIKVVSRIIASSNNFKGIPMVSKQSDVNHCFSLCNLHCTVAKWRLLTKINEIKIYIT